MEARDHTLDEARAAKGKAAERFAGLPVVGLGITRVGAGYGLKVNLGEPTASVPGDVDGVPVKTEVVGNLAKRRSP